MAYGWRSRLQFLPSLRAGPGDAAVPPIKRPCVVFASACGNGGRGEGSELHRYLQLWGSQSNLLAVLPPSLFAVVSAVTLNEQKKALTASCQWLLFVVQAYSSST